MLAVKFYEDVKDELLRFAVVIAKHDGKWGVDLGDGEARAYGRNGCGKI